MSEKSSFSLAGMSAETGYEEESQEQEFRISAFLSVLFGVLGFLGVITPILVLIPALGLLLAIFSRRKFKGLKPVGYKLSVLGGVLSMFFLFLGFFVHYLEQKSMGGQAEYFAREYMKIVALDEAELALELQKAPVDRFLKGMSLKEFYARLQEDRERKLKENSREMVEGSVNVLADFRAETVNKRLRQLGPDAQWELIKAPLFHQQYGVYRTDLYLKNTEGEKPFEIWIQLELSRNKKTNGFEWKVSECAVNSQQLYAESVL